MAKLNVNPTRMALSNLKGRLVTAKRGHKLLKDKQDELMRRFIEMIRKNKKLRVEVEKELSNSFKSFLLASAVMSPEFLEQAVAFPKEQVSVAIETKNVMSVNIPKMEFNRTESNGAIFPYGYAQTSSELDDAILELYTRVPGRAYFTVLLRRLLSTRHASLPSAIMATDSSGWRNTGVSWAFSSLSANSPNA